MILHRIIGKELQMNLDGDYKLLRPVPEMKYLNVDNTHRYRVIMRYFFAQYNRAQFWMKPEEVFEAVQQDIDNYVLEQCQADLEQLSDWGNLTEQHDGTRSSTIDEFKRKRKRYFMTPYSIKIEQLLISLERTTGYGGSLETNLFDKIIELLKVIREKIDDFKEGEADSHWTELYQSFRKLHENSVDYMASLHSVKAEEMMLTDAFLAFKDQFIHYLNDFVYKLFRSSAEIEHQLTSISSVVLDLFLQRVAEDRMQKPTIEEVTKEEILEELCAGWGSLRNWFLQDGSTMSELMIIERVTKDAIQRIIRSVNLIQERRKVGLSRRRELEQIASWFYKQTDVGESHRLAAYIYGLFVPRHLHGQMESNSDLTNRSLWEEAPIVRPLRSRSRKKIGKSLAEPVRDQSKKQKEALREYRQKIQEEEKWLEEMVTAQEVSISDLKGLSAKRRSWLLQLIGRCIANKKRIFETADGFIVQLFLPPDGEETVLECEDGDLYLLNYKLIFKRI